MNEIEEYLLMIFLEERSLLDEGNFEYVSNRGGIPWVFFKIEELGRTLPEEFEFYVSDWAIKEIKSGKAIGVETCLWMQKREKGKNKIKITVVEE
jgi:hypothetical protein